MVHLYSLTLQKSGGINAAVYGNFSAPKAQEIVVARNKTIELLRPDETGKVQTVCSVEAFGIVRSIPQQFLSPLADRQGFQGIPLIFGCFGMH